MKKYEPAYVADEQAIQGWESAALFVQGVKMAGNDLTWPTSSRRTTPRRSPLAVSEADQLGVPGTVGTPRRTAAPYSSVG